MKVRNRARGIHSQGDDFLPPSGGRCLDSPLPVRRLHRCASILASPHRFKGSMVPGHPIETWGQDDDPPFVTLLRQRL